MRKVNKSAFEGGFNRVFMYHEINLDPQLENRLFMLLRSPIERLWVIRAFVYV